MISRFAACTRKLVAVLPVLAVFALVASPPAAAYDPPFAAIVVDVNGGRVLHEVNADHLRYPASITKVMTLYLVFERLERGTLALDTPLRVSARAAAEPPSKIGVKAGTTITVEQAIKALVTRSANDVATVVAENLGGSTEGFAALMTRRARAIGMENTEFRNAHGLPNAAQTTTARDLAILAVAIQDRFPEYYAYFQTRSFEFGEATHPNHNRLLGRVRGVDGIKTGFIRASGFNLMTNARVDDRHIVTIVLGGRSGAHRDGIVTGLVERYIPQAFAGTRTTRMVGFSPAAGRRIVAADVPLPPSRPDDVPVLVIAQVEPEVDPEEAEQAGRRAVAAFGEGEADQGSTPIRALARERQARDTDEAVEVAADEPDIAAEVTAGGPIIVEEEADAIPLPPVRPVGLGAAAALSGHAIQLSAAVSERSALDLLERAKAQVGGPLTEARPVAERVVNGTRTIYRARFAGFDCFQARL